MEQVVCRCESSFITITTFCGGFERDASAEQIMMAERM